MRIGQMPRLAISFTVAALAVAAPLIAGQIKGEIKSVDPKNAQVVVTDDETKKDVTISLARLTAKGSRLGKSVELKDLKPGVKVVVNEAVVASGIEIADSQPKVRGPILQEFWHNFTHNLFKPLLLFFYLGFLVPILKVEFEFPYVIYQGLTIYLLLAIGWHGGEELARIDPSSIENVAGLHDPGLRAQFPHRHPRLRAADRDDPDAADRRGDGRRLLRLGLCGHLRDLRRRAGDGRDGLRRLHAGHAGDHGDPGLPGRPLPGGAAEAQGDGRAGQHARRAGL